MYFLPAHILQTMMILYNCCLQGWSHQFCGNECRGCTIRSHLVAISSRCSGWNHVGWLVPVCCLYFFSFSSWGTATGVTARYIVPQLQSFFFILFPVVTSCCLLWYNVFAYVLWVSSKAGSGHRNSITTYWCCRHDAEVPSRPSALHATSVLYTYLLGAVLYVVSLS